MVSTIRIRAKAPTGFFTKDSEIVPIGDGQWDLEVEAQIGRSFCPLPVYVNLDLGYKFRFEPDPDKTNLDPGDEFTLRGELGLNPRKNILLKVEVEGFWGKEFTDIVSNLKLRNWQRRILYLKPGVIWTIVEHFEVEPFIKFSLSGKNYPAGEVFGLGLAYTLSLF